MISFLLKGLIRDRSRSLFPVLMVSAGVFLTVFLYCFMQGAMGDLISSTAKFDTGHVKVMTQAYRDLADQVPNDLAIIGADALLVWLKENEKEMIWAQRIRFGGLLDVPDERGETLAQAPVMGLGIDLFSEDTPEKNLFNIEKAMVRGSYPRGPNEILISDEFAQKMGLHIGSTVTLISSTMYGAMATYNFKIAGTVYFGMIPMDRGTIIADIRDVQNALDMTDSAGEIVGYTHDMLYSGRRMGNVAQRFNKTFTMADDEFSPVMVSLGQQNNFEEYLNYAEAMEAVIVGIFVLAMSIVLWNSGLMNGLRRYGEIGVRLAMGESKGRLYRSMILESFFVGIAGSVLGTALGLVVSYYMQYTGINFGEMMPKSSMLISNIIRAQVTPASYIIGFFPGVFASVTGAMFAGIGIYKRQTAQLIKELEV
ncbi:MULTISPECIES: FtsX-like permease family protein [Aminobacterium]|jgi:putative ABC transport system permease protein|uniref:ABC transporter permease n=2 Tax=Aminobacteriaceae TaxID=3029087 RepID=UPI000463CC23|nr:MULTISPECIES: FtsX-like permease family protein [Aminobacterium]